MKNKEYGYTLYFKRGNKTRHAVSAPSEELAIASVTAINKVRPEVQFFTFDTLDLPCDYDWDVELEKWQARLF